MDENTIPTVDVAGVPDPLPAGLVVVDVREDDEWASGHVDGALHIPLSDLAARIDEVPAEGQVLVYCRSGGRSARATAFLQQRGVDAVNLAGGVIAWHQAGRRLV
ncbi:rhodanese-like domain-containing protein [Mumia sp. zg.B53]|uniref:rhodanese-like domain-containing protein n=1 Tax=unclassified Mumia TaxID=2621872 RepID=UPI001C6E9622|nr:MULTISPECIES: rhodanese-like domain-containing protein [unclassified Mumia]MBW9207631.1 rhodanese-like domain-containing protein [Mumia sp. zg.B17]MBW9210024.1 rhodanese-like domain-containing protein [Mumia sp. zg.B21]MBW9214627.1 rhodanese-like domain-containing protein [Mumia sp. zg.B53]MDD9348880.1 rhodanese-like domain-containing protein [Mumia sp.]